MMNKRRVYTLWMLAFGLFLLFSIVLLNKDTGSAVATTIYGFVAFLSLVGVFAFALKRERTTK